MALAHIFSVPVLAASFTLFAIYILTRVFRRKSFRLPPGPPSLPFLGNAHTLAFTKSDQSTLLNKWAEEYGDIYMFSLFGTNFVMLNDVDLANEIYATEDVHGRAPMLPCNKALGLPNTGYGILGADGGQGWKAIRKFFQSILRNVTGISQTDAKYEQLVTSHAKKYVDNVSMFNESYFDPSEGMFVTIANITSAFTFGKTYEYDDEEFLKLLSLTRETFNCMGAGGLTYHVPILWALPTSSNRKLVKVVREMLDFLDEIIREQRSSTDFAQRDGEFTSLIDSFYKEQIMRRSKGEELWPFDDNNLLQLTWDMCLAGFETVSASLIWYILIMAQHPEVQRKVQAELDRVVGRDRMPKLGDRSELPFARATLVESFRISGMVPSHFPRHVKRDFKAKGYDIPKGSYVAINAGWLSRTPTVWKNPDEFCPERFIDRHGAFDSTLEAKLGIFGSGRRICAGEQLAQTELFLISTHLLHRFTLQLPEGTPVSLAGKDGLVHHPLPFKLRALPR